MSSADHYTHSSVYGSKVYIAIKFFILTFLLIFIPDNAYADMIVPFIWIVSTEMVTALIPIIIIEAIVYAILLKLPIGRSFRLSTAANFISTLIGVVLLLIIDSAIGGPFYIDPFFAITGGVVLFVLTLVIEYRVARYMLLDYGYKDILISVICANIVSYSIILLYYFYYDVQ